MSKMMGRYFYKREATDEQRMDRVWEMEELRALIGKRFICVLNNDYGRELDELWVGQEENLASAQLGSNWGYYVGKESIARYYAKYEKAENYCRIAPPDSVAIHIAADGKTAFGVCYTLASEAHDIGGVHGWSVFNRVWFDFKKEESGWRIWHMFIGNDGSAEAGRNVNEEPALYYEDKQGPDPVKLDFGDADYPMQTYYPVFGWYPYPTIPTAHDSYRLDLSCSFEGFLQFKAGQADPAKLYEAIGGDKA